MNQKPTSFKLPYYAVIFISKKNPVGNSYQKMFKAALKLACEKYGCLAFKEGNNQTQGTDISISYWSDLSSIQAWRQDSFHQKLITKGQKKWYQFYQLEIAKIEKAYHFYQH